MTHTYKKKLIEVAIPLEAINAASAREKSIRHGHPSTLHLWWARRPLAACRAVLFAQLVDDPSSRADELMADPGLRAHAEAELPARVAAWEKSKASAKGVAANAPEPTLEGVAVEIERKRLFAIIEDLVKWENSTNEEVLERARAEIRRSCGGELPPVYDPFSGGGSIPLEAQRLGLPAYGSDLNPVAVMIGKAMIEIPPKFNDKPPIHPGIKARSFYRNAEGLAEDVRYYGEWMREKARERIGHLYPPVNLPKEYGGGKATVIAWIWARTVPSPDPAFSDVQVPIASNFLLSSKDGKEAWIQPVVDKSEKTIEYVIRRKGSKSELTHAKSGTKAGRGANFRCLVSDTAITPAYVKGKSAAGERGDGVLAMIAETPSGRAFLSPDLSSAIQPNLTDAERNETPRLPRHSQYVGVLGYGFDRFADLHTARQFRTLEAFCELIADVRNQVQDDYRSSEIQAATGDMAHQYADGIAHLLTCAIGRAADFWNTGATWEHAGGFIAHIFTRQAIPMVWDYAEANPFSSGTGSWSKTCVEWVAKVVENLNGASVGRISQMDAQNVSLPAGAVISTDPPYYDNVPYADISDFFYHWHRRALSSQYPELYQTLSVPKQEELVADRVRHGDAETADAFFLEGMRSAMQKMQSGSSATYPATIYYAFKQSEISVEGVTSTGWATFLQAVIDAGYAVLNTWPVRTERSARMRAIGSNALASSVVIVCRKREIEAETVTRAEFIRALKRALPSALVELQAANITPADVPQAAIGPGMGVFSRYKAVLEADDSPMTVKTALQLINVELDEYLGGIQGEFDAETRFAITWFEQNGVGKGEYGVADNLARARGISVDSVKHAGIVESAAGKVRLLKRDELDPDWAPEEDGRLTVWECLQHLVRLHEKTGLAHDTAALLKRFGPQAEAVKDLAYCLYDIAANKRREASEATVYNALIADWSELSQMAATVSLEGRDRQMRFAV